MNDILFKNNIATQVYLFLVKKAMNKEIVHYSDIAVEFNLPNVGNSLAAAVSPILGDIFRFCEKVNQPALTSIVVRKSGSEMGLPGPGFWSLYSPNHELFTKKAKRDIVARFHREVFGYWGSFSTPIVEAVTEVIEEIKQPRYYIDTNRCDCHPETCCCDPYAIYERSKGLINPKVATAFNMEKAEELCDLYNKGDQQ